MLNGDLYPKGQRLWHKGINLVVEYICYAGNGIHIVLAPPTDCLDDRVREVGSDQLVDETVLDLPLLEERGVEASCINWIRRNQTHLYRSYRLALGRLEGAGFLPGEGLVAEGGFLFYAVFRYEERRLRLQMAPGSRAHN